VNFERFGGEGARKVVGEAPSGENSPARARGGTIGVGRQLQHDIDRAFPVDVDVAYRQAMSTIVGASLSGNDVPSVCERITRAERVAARIGSVSASVRSSDGVSCSRS
jgi:hypothetical protein